MARGRKRELPPNVAAALGEFKAALRELYGERLRDVFLFGSYARGDFRDDSDVDVLVVLSGEVKRGEEISRINEFVSPICLQHDLLIGTVVVAEDRFNRQVEPLFQNVVREGVLV